MNLDIPVEEYTTPCPEFAMPETAALDVLKQMREGGFRHMPILQENQVMGILSERDISIVEQIWDGVDIQAQDIMIKDPYVVEPGTPLEEVVFEMSKNKWGSAVVKDQNDFLGIFTSTDALNALVEILRDKEQ